MGQREELGGMMPRYQIRTTKNEGLEKLFSEVVDKAWTAASQYFDPRQMQPEDRDDFISATRTSLRPYISTFDLCGLGTECADEIEGGPWLDYEDHVYHLVVPDTFNEFVHQLALSAFHTIQHLPKKNSDQSAYEAIENVFRREFAEHLYYNPACGRIDLCSDSRPVNPWKR
jgi:hypothetical protein